MPPADDLPSKRARNPPPPPPPPLPPAQRIKRKRAVEPADDERTSKLLRAGDDLNKAPSSVGPDGKTESKLDFNLFPDSALQEYLIKNGLIPVFDPSPYSDLPAPLPSTLFAPQQPIPPGVTRAQHLNPYGRTAILADIQQAHDVFAAQAKDHWETSNPPGSGALREGEVVTGFLYACKVGNRVLKVVPPPL